LSCAYFLVKIEDENEVECVGDDGDGDESGVDDADDEQKIAGYWSPCATEVEM
jgi:hypothetical protein